MTERQEPLFDERPSGAIAVSLGSLVWNLPVKPGPDLRESVAAVGVLHPIFVYPAGEPGMYVVEDGRRRCQSAHAAGQGEVNALVFADRASAQAAALRAHTTRKPNGVSEYHQVVGMTITYGVDETAKRLHIPRPQVERIVGLGLLPKPIYKLFLQGKLPLSLALEIQKHPLYAREKLAQDAEAGVALTAKVVRAARQVARKTAQAETVAAAPDLFAAPEVEATKHDTIALDSADAEFVAGWLDYLVDACKDEGVRIPAARAAADERERLQRLARQLRGI